MCSKACSRVFTVLASLTLSWKLSGKRASVRLEWIGGRCALSKPAGGCGHGVADHAVHSCLFSIGWGWAICGVCAHRSLWRCLLRGDGRAGECVALLPSLPRPHA